MLPKTRTEQAIELWLSGDKVKALAIFRTFTINIPKEVKRSIQIAYESLTDSSRKSFYESIGVDVSKEIEAAFSHIEENYGEK